MTATNILIQRDAVHLFTDGTGISESDYVVQIISTKQFAVPGVLAVCGLRGCRLVQRDLETALNAETFSSFNDFKADLGGLLFKLTEDRSSVWDAVPWTTHPGGEYDLFVAGWSESEGPMGFCWSRRREVDVSWTMSYLDSQSGLMAPTDPAIDAMYVPIIESLAQQTNGRSVEPLLLSLMQMQRQSYPVGGHVDMTTITATGMATRRIATWPDVVGQKIDNGAQPTRVNVPLLLKRAAFDTFSGYGTAHMIQAGSVSAVKMEAQTITSESGVIGQLGVKSLSLGDNAVTVPQTQSFENQLGPGGSWPGVCRFNVSVDTTGLAGKVMNLFGSFTATLLYADNTAVGSDSYLIINNAIVARNNSIDKTGVASMSGGYQFTANGSVMTFEVRVDWYPSQNVAMTYRTAFAMVTKR